MKKLYFLITGFLWSMLATGQTPLIAPPPQRTCATETYNDRMQAKLQRQNPAYRTERSTGTTGLAWRSTATVYSIPVIVHVIHNGEAAGAGRNISAQQIQSQLDVLNEDFGNTNADGTLVPSAFQPYRTDTEIRFVQAQRDPNGNVLAEPGIHRVDRNAMGWTAPPYATSGPLGPNTDYIDNTIKPATSWDPTRYLNIWVLDLGAGLLGYAQFPDNTAALGGLNTSGGTAATDGVVILHTSYGRVGNVAAPYNKGRTTTHEVGHWLGLRHIWGDGSCATDYCADTPTQQTSNYGCPTYPKRTCSNTTSGDMFMNYMDYTDDACMFMFSADQKARMQSVMAAGTPRRSSLATSNVGCSSVVAATASNSGASCPGGSITLTATGPAGATYAWTGPNGYTSTQQNPVLSNVTDAMAGTYSVTVSFGSACPGQASTIASLTQAPPTPTITPSAGSTCAGNAVTLAGAVPPTVLMEQNFNAAPTGWTQSSADQGSAWALRGAPYTAGALSAYSLDGTRFIMASSDLAGPGVNTNSTLFSPSFSTSGFSTVTLNFQHYYIYSNKDQPLKVEASLDGTTWTTVATYTTAQGTSTTPASASLTLNAATYANKPNVYLRWVYASAKGSSYWSIDNIQVSGMSASMVYAWTLVSGDGLPATTNTASISVSPTQTSVYRLSASYTSGACATSSTVTVNVAESTWTGAAGNNNWNDAANWTGCVPTRTRDALIPTGLGSYPVIGTGTAEVRQLTQNGGLTLSGGELAVYGNYDGPGTLTQTSGTLALRGSGEQLLRGGTYRALSIAGSGNKVLMAPLTVTQTLLLSNGVLHTGAHELTLGSAATISETEESYVHGQVKTTRTVSTTLETFGGLGLSLTPGVAPGATTVTRVTGQPQTGQGTSQSIGRYFDITAAVNQGLNATLTLSYFDHELNGIPETELDLFKSSNGGASWGRQVFTSRNAAANTVTKTGVDGFSRWTLGSSANPLPVELTSFTAERRAQAALLRWATAQEKNSYRFEVELSTNGSVFRRIGQVAGQGTTSQRHDYEFMDAQALNHGADLLYYRLVQVDLDGTSQVSQVRTLLLTDRPSLTATASPVPFGEYLTVEVKAAVAGAATLTLHDAVGRQVRRQVAELTKGINTVALSKASVLHSGTYVLTVEQGGKPVRLKVVRE